MRAPAQVDGPVARLVARVRHLRPRLLRAPAAAVPGFLQEGPRLSQDRQGQLGPGRPHRARQRAGDRRPRLALGRARRAARADAVVLQDHRLFADELLDALDGARASGRRMCACMQANWIGRSDGLPCASRWKAPSCPRSCRRLEVFTTRPDTLFGASFMAISPEHPLAAARGQEEPDAGRPSSRSAASIGTSDEALAKAEKQGFDTGIVAVHPFKPDVKLPVYVANFILMGYGTGAIFGCPAHDQRDLDFARKYGLPVIPVVLPPGADPATFAGRRRGLPGRRHDDQFRVPRRPDDRGGQGRGSRSGWSERQASARARSTIACATGASRASAIGAARSRSSIARTAASCRCPTTDLPVKLPDDATFDKPGNPLDHHPTWKHVDVPEVRPAGRARDRHDGHLRRQLLVLSSASLRAARRDADRQEGGQVLAAGRPVHRRHGARDPASALCALLHARHEGHRSTCRLDEPFASVFTQGMVTHETYRSENGDWLTPAEVRIEGEGAARKATSIATGRPVEIGSDREDVEVAQEPGRSRRHHRPLRRRYGARWFMLSDSPPERDVIWTEAGVAGAGRLIQRIWRLIDQVAERKRTRNGSGPAGSSARGAGAAARRAQDSEQRQPEHRGPALQRGRGPDLRVDARPVGRPGQVRARASTGPCARPPSCWCR